MITRIRDRGLRRLHERNDSSYLPPQHVDKIEDILSRLDVASEPSEMSVPGFRLHQLHGNLEGHWAVRVSRNWRITFRFVGTDVTDIDLVDYH